MDPRLSFILGLLFRLSLYITGPCVYVTTVKKPAPMSRFYRFFLTYILCVYFGLSVFHALKSILFSWGVLDHISWGIVFYDFCYGFGSEFIPAFIGGSIAFWPLSRKFKKIGMRLKEPQPTVSFDPRPASSSSPLAPETSAFTDKTAPSGQSRAFYQQTDAFSEAIASRDTTGPEQFSADSMPEPPASKINLSSLPELTHVNVKKRKAQAPPDLTPKLKQKYSAPPLDQEPEPFQRPPQLKYEYRGDPSQAPDRFFSASKSPSQPAPPAKKPKRLRKFAVVFGAVLLCCGIGAAGAYFSYQYGYGEGYADKTKELSEKIHSLNVKLTTAYDRLNNSVGVLRPYDDIYYHKHDSPCVAAFDDPPFFSLSLCEELDYIRCPVCW